MWFSPLLLLQVNNNAYTFFLGKHRSGLPHCLRMFGRINGKSEEERGSVRAVREADGYVPSERKFWKIKQGWRGYFKSTENSSSWKCSIILKPCPSKRLLAIRYFLQDYGRFSLFLNIISSVPYRSLLEIN